jgi:hypothetical protein
VSDLCFTRGPRDRRSPRQGLVTGEAAECRTIFAAIIGYQQSHTVGFATDASVWADVANTAGLEERVRASTGDTSAIRRVSRRLAALNRGGRRSLNGARAGCSWLTPHRQLLDRPAVAVGVLEEYE